MCELPPEVRLPCTAGDVTGGAGPLVRRLSSATVSAVATSWAPLMPRPLPPLSYHSLVSVALTGRKKKCDGNQPCATCLAYKVGMASTPTVNHVYGRVADARTSACGAARTTGGNRCRGPRRMRCAGVLRSSRNSWRITAPGWSSCRSSGRRCRVSRALLGRQPSGRSLRRPGTLMMSRMW